MESLFEEVTHQSPQHLSLFDLCCHIKKVAEANYPHAIWISAEIFQCNFAKGNYYLSLVQKEQDQIVATAEAAIWQASMRNIKQHLGAAADEVFRAGNHVLVKVRVQYSERYGLKLLIEDADPAFTLGYMAVQRAETVQKLKSEGLLAKNRLVPLPLFPQRIALISSERAAGYHDFVNQLAHNPYGYTFEITLFETTVQGQDAPAELTQQLKNVGAQRQHFDCVAMVRGGGSKLDLGAFDAELLCRAIASCPLPVVTGIGHEVDEALADLVAHTALKTPTAAAEFFVSRGVAVEGRLGDLRQRLSMASSRMLKEGHRSLDLLQRKVFFMAREICRTNELQLGHIENVLQLLQPQRQLERGYSIVQKDGATVVSPNMLKEGEELVVYASGGSYRVKVLG